MLGRGQRRSPAAAQETRSPSPAHSRFSWDDACSRRGPASAARPLATGLAATRGERRAARRLSQRLPAALRAQRDDPVIGRRDLVKLAAVAALPTPAARRSGGYDVAVIGAGVFGAWTAWHLQRAGRRVLIVDAHGPANARASSGGESRVIRLGYGKDQIYTRMALASLRFWSDLSRRAVLPVLHRIGVLELIGRDDRYARESREAIRRAGGRVEDLSRSELAKRYPQISLEGITAGQLEPASGAVMARRAVLTLVQEMVAAGATYLQAAVAPPAGNGRFARRALPVWAGLSDLENIVYGMPDLEARGFKLAFDAHGPPIDPDALERQVTPAGLAASRDFLVRRFPALAQAPLVESRVCQYENTSNGDFLIDRHPELENVWLVGGGSGHGFKHGPAVGDYAARALLGSLGSPEPRFSLATKQAQQQRAVY